MAIRNLGKHDMRAGVQVQEDGGGREEEGAAPHPRLAHRHGHHQGLLRVRLQPRQEARHRRLFLATEGVAVDVVSCQGAGPGDAGVEEVSDAAAAPVVGDTSADPGE